MTWGKVWVKLNTHSAGGITDLDFALARKIEDVVLWRPEPGGDVRVNLRDKRGQSAFLGEAASHIGQFPVRLRLPPNVALEVICLVGGQPVQTLTLPVPDRRNQQRPPSN